MPYREVLEYAARVGLIVVSHDINTVPDHAAQRMLGGQPLTGLFMVQQKEAVGPIVEGLILIWAASEAEEWREQIVLLPIR